MCSRFGFHRIAGGYASTFCIRKWIPALSGKWTPMERIFTRCFLTRKCPRTSAAETGHRMAMITISALVEAPISPSGCRPSADPSFAEPTSRPCFWQRGRYVSALLFPALTANASLCSAKSLASSYSAMTSKLDDSIRISRASPLAPWISRPMESGLPTLRIRTEARRRNSHFRQCERMDRAGLLTVPGSRLRITSSTVPGRLSCFHRRAEAHSYPSKQMQTLSNKTRPGRPMASLSYSRNGTVWTKAEARFTGSIRSQGKSQRFPAPMVFFLPEFLPRGFISPLLVPTSRN